MRRFFSRLAVYFGLKEDDSPEPAAAPEQLTPRGVFAIVFAGIITGFILEYGEALLGGDTFTLGHAVWHGALLGGVSLLLRIVEYRVRDRSRSQPERDHSMAS